MAETDGTKFELHILKHLLQPSYLSASLAVLTAIIAVGSVIISRIYLSTGWLADTLRTISDSNQSVFARGATDGSSPFNAVLLFLFWACVGLTVYFTIIGLAQMIREVREIELEMDYVHTNRKAILMNYTERAVARFTGLVLTFITAATFLKLILPYTLSTLSTAKFTVSDVLATVLAMVFMLLTLHLLAVLLRVIALRPRLFTAEIEA